MLCGLLGALSVITSRPLRVPVAVGVNVTFAMQLLPGAIGAPHAFVWAKSPEICSDVIVSAPVPLLLTMSCWELLVEPSTCGGNVREVGVGLAAATVPVPVSATVWGELFPPKLTVSVPVRGPVAVGVNTTLTSHFWPPATGLTQLLVCEKSPDIETVGDMAASPKLPTAMSTEGVEVPTSSLPNDTALDQRTGTGDPRLGTILAKKYSRRSQAEVPEHSVLSELNHYPRNRVLLWDQAQPLIQGPQNYR